MATKRLGAYEIVDEIGRGGMAVVYKAWQPSLERYVALKVLPEYFQHDPEFLARFHREAKAAAKLNHPNIVTVYDTGKVDGRHYIAMEYVEGGSLRERLGKGPLDLDEVQRILIQVADALDHAHAHGLIHRDIKPANILFTGDPDEQSGHRPKVTDFGIAQAADGTRLTRSGAILGTPEYMAPEQAKGEAVDRRADLYALGVVLYLMLTGQAPFRGTTPHATLHAVIYDPPPPPRQLNPELSPAMQTVVLKALAKHPEDRFQSGKALAAAFRRARTGAPVRVPDTAQRSAGPTLPARRRVRYLAAATVAVVVILAGLIGWSLLSSDGSEGGAAGTATVQAATGTAAALLHQSGTATAIAMIQAQATDEAIRATERALRATADVLDARSATGTAEALAREQMTATAEAV
ncbi:MAG: serine/threonine-protein kinase, partial [Anaerolineae bacterium]